MYYSKVSGTKRETTHQCGSFLYIYLVVSICFLSEQAVITYKSSAKLLLFGDIDANNF